MPAHRYEEYESNGQNVTVQQVNEGGSVSAWINKFAAHADKAERHVPIYVDSDMSEWERVKRVVSYMVHTNLYYCKKCDSLYDSGDMVKTGFAGHKCAACTNNACLENKKHEYTVTNPRQKHNARVATRYKCVHCGHTKQSTPTG